MHLVPTARRSTTIVCAIATLAALLTITSTSPEPAAAAVTQCDGLLWEGSDDSTGQIWTSNPDGSERDRMTVGVGTTANFSGAWSHDGTRIAWSGLDDGLRSIWIANADGSGASPVPAIGPGTDPIGNSRPSWSPDDQRIAWQGWDGATFQIYVANVDGTERVLLSSVGADPDPTDNANAVWSPTGDEIAWGGSDQVYVADADGTNRREISSVGIDQPVSASRPQWSPDGTRLLFSGQDGITSQIYVSNTDGSDRIQVSAVGEGLDPNNNFNPRWSPDGSRIAWEGRGQIWVANPDGTDREAISEVGAGVAPISNRTPVWSPDGSRLAWEGQVDGVKTVFVANSDGTDRVSVSDADDGDDPVSSLVPQWRPRAGDVSISSSSTDLFVGEDASIVVTVSAACLHSGVVVDGLTAPACLGDPDISVSAGSVVDGRWSIGLLDGAATATISGTVDELGACTGTAQLVESLPVDPTPAAADFGESSSVNCPSMATHGFVDVSATSFADGDIACIKALGITTGTSAETFSPAGSVTREQMAAFLGRLWRALGGVCSSEPHGFVDVSATSFADGDIACIKALGITTGTSAETFSPAGSVTREQMAAFLGRLIRAQAEA